ncbi:hypothetical protein EDD93_6041 [Streptomyces sp. 840.1]|nr:hypothetical protein EDD93_6041 [Streptomyces sp. 840.1]
MYANGPSQPFLASHSEAIGPPLYAIGARRTVTGQRAAM